MKKSLLSLVLAVALCASVGLVTFAKEAETNCIGDPSGMTNCGDAAVEESDGGANTVKALNVDTDILTFGRITELGRRYSKTVTIENGTSRDVTVQVETMAYEESEEENPMLDWLTFAQGKHKYELKAHGSMQLAVRLLVPAEVSGGTYYAKIKVSNGDKESDQYVTVRADIATDDYKYGGEIVSQTVNFFNIGEEIGADAKVKNSGTAGFTAIYKVNYKNAFGLPEWKSLVEETREVLPGKEEEFSIGDEGKIGFGIFTVEQIITYTNSDGKAMEARLSHSVINMPWWGLAIFVAAVILIVVIIVVIKKKKKSQEQEEKKERKLKKKSATVEVEDE